MGPSPLSAKNLLLTAPLLALFVLLHLTYFYTAPTDDVRVGAAAIALAADGRAARQIPRAGRFIQPASWNSTLLKAPPTKGETLSNAPLPTCNVSGALLSVADGGRLGNQMSQYATLLGFAKNLAVAPVVTRPMKNRLSSIFDGVSVAALEQGPKRAFNFTGISVERAAEAKHCSEIFSRTRQKLMISGYPNLVEVYNSYRDDVVKQFKFKPTVVKAVNMFLDEIRNKSGLGPDGVVVGVHARRTDYKHYLLRKSSGHLASKAYFSAAMDLFRKRYPGKVVFVMASDEIFWCKTMFQLETDVRFVSEAESLRSHSYAAAFDLAVMSMSDHSIISHGTFGFWGAYLAGGDAIVADGYFNPKRRPVLMKAAAFLGWKTLKDPCYTDGKITDKCAENKLQYGIT